MPWEKQFDVEATLEKAGEAFWTQGYEATSMSDLLRVMGIQKGSFYNTYGSKHEVYLRALEQYASTSQTKIRELIAGKGALESLRAHFEMIYEDCISPNGHRGCMILNCALELAYQDRQAQAIVKQGLARHETLLRELIEAGQQTGEISQSLDSRATAKALMSFVMGMRVYSRSGSEPETIRTLADQAIGLVTPAESVS